MPDLKQKIINEIIRVEGGFVDDPSDSGGATNFGITETVARAYGYFGSMRDLTREDAFNIYSDMYWDSIRGNGLAALSERVAEEVVDTAVNMGVKRASEFLQRALNVLNNREKYYSDISTDGIIGDGTLMALESCVFKRGDEVLVKMLNCLQGAFYDDLAERRGKDERFIAGWFKHRVKL